MNSSQPTDQPGDSAIERDPIRGPIVLDAKALKQVAGGAEAKHVDSPLDVPGP